MFMIDECSESLKQEFREYLSRFLPVPALPREEERALLEMAAAHALWSAGNPDTYADVLVVDSPHDAQQRTAESCTLHPAHRAAANSMLSRLRQTTYKAINNTATPTVQSTLLRIASDAIADADLCLGPVRRQCETELLRQRDNDYPLSANDAVLPFCECLERILVRGFLAEKLSPLVRSLQGVVLIAVRCPFVFLHERTLVVGLAPTRVFFNGGQQLHRTDGPAIEFRDGTGIACVGGVRVPDSLFSANHGITPEMVLLEHNAEVRRIYLERIGIEAFLAGISAKAVASDDFGTLYHSTYLADEHTGGPGHETARPRAYVRLLNATPEPGTDDVFKEYLLRVPPDLKTPHAAVAWSFGLDPHTYVPTAET